MGDPILDPTNKSLTTRLKQRPFFVRPGNVNTFRLMHDPPRPSNPFVGSQSYYQNNEVTYFVNGADSFNAMGAAMATANAPGCFIYMANWYVDVTVPMGGKTLQDTLTDAANAGAQVRALFYKNAVMVAAPYYRYSVLQNTLTPFTPTDGDPAGVWDLEGTIVAAAYDTLKSRVIVVGGVPYHNEAEANVVRALPRQPPHQYGFHAAIVDGLVPFAGSHHQKFLVVKGADELTAFAGGVDFNFDRLGFLYDVHCQVRGPAARGILETFNERWLQHPDQASASKGEPHVGDPGPMPPSLPAEFSDVQIARTYADGTKKPVPMDAPSVLEAEEYAKHSLFESARGSDPFYSRVSYPFAPSGAAEVWEIYKAALAQAKQFIYIENQYLTSLELAAQINAAVGHVDHVIILIQSVSDIDKDGGVNRTKRCIDIVRQNDTKKKVKVFVRQPGSGSVSHQYVHSKTMVIDDQYAIIGSANGARRSFNYDTEIAVGVFDRVPADRAVLSFARRLRMRLWKENLEPNFPDIDSLADARAAACYWARLASGTPKPSPQGWSLMPWDAFLRTLPSPAPSIAADWEWDEVRDPVPPGPL